MNQTASVSHQVKCQSTKTIKVSFVDSSSRCDELTADFLNRVSAEAL